MIFKTIQSLISEPALCWSSKKGCFLHILGQVNVSNEIKGKLKHISIRPTRVSISSQRHHAFNTRAAAGWKCLFLLNRTRITDKFRYCANAIISLNCSPLLHAEGWSSLTAGLILRCDCNLFQAATRMHLRILIHTLGFHSHD